MKLSVLPRLRALFSVDRSNSKLLSAQYVALSRQLPVMYVILLVNTVALAVTHVHMAPRWLAVFLPLLLTSVGSLRATLWWRKRGVPASPEAILQTLTRTNRLAVFLAFGFTAWALALYPYGDAYARSHIAFYMAITVIACIFCMMHLRSAALITTAVVNMAFIGFFLSTGTYVYMAMAVNVLLVSGAMIWILHDHYQDFTRLVTMQAHTEKLSEDNQRLANQDSLTGLPNRRQFFALLERSLAEASDQQSRLAVGLIDLDGFKPVNDLYGHSVGDKLLFQVGQRLIGYESAGLHLARLGGDEFGLLKMNASAEDLEHLGRDIQALLQAPFSIGDIQVTISASLGFVIYPDMATDGTQAYEFADYALYQSKRTGPGSICVFSAGHHLDLSRDLRTEQGLRKADVSEEFSVVYQPIVDIRSGRTVAFEALARWLSPQLGQVAPGQFIPVAERLGLINRLTVPLLKKALAGALSWPGDVRLAFNLSAHDCGSRQAVCTLIKVIEESGMNPTRLDFEITETAVIQDIEQAQWAVAAFRALGCGISLDDFGTGYSSLSQLHGLALTKLKIDRSFITDIQSNPASYKIVKSLLALSADMGLECVSEGVETAQELAVLRKLGCVLVQGYLIAKPMSQEDSVVWLCAGQGRFNLEALG
jgi:diguanylate cyclase (GGDEF)-like protein